MTQERTTLEIPLSPEPANSGAPERVRLLGAPWLKAQATKLMDPQNQVRVELNTPAQVIEVLLSGPEAHTAIRQLAQAYADSIGKSLTVCVYPSTDEQAPLNISGRKPHRGRWARWEGTCTDDDCWCWWSEFHNPRGV